MEFDDYLQPEIAVTAAVTAVVFSPGARKLLRPVMQLRLSAAAFAASRRREPHFSHGRSSNRPPPKVKEVSSGGTVERRVVGTAGSDAS